MLTPDVILNWFLEIETQLPLMVGFDKWQKISEEVHRLIGQLQTENDHTERLRLSARLVGLLVTYPETRSQLQVLVDTHTGNEFASQIADDLFVQLSLFKDQLEISTGALETSIGVALNMIRFVSAVGDEQARLITLSASSVKDTKSIKLENFSIDWSELADLAASLITTLYGKAVHPIVVCAGILLIVRSLLRMITVEISMTEASVLWGLIHSRDSKGYAKEYSIVVHTNSERARFGQSPLEDTHIIEVLHRLKLLKTVDFEDGQMRLWRVTEKCQVS